ncbi:MAG: adenosine deaminase [Planctomycetaceae bacterium]|nr:adenosine deaminase [Planctomycetaceae bacterium]
MIVFSRALLALMLVIAGSLLCQGQAIDGRSSLQATSDYYDQITSRLDISSGPNVAALNQFFSLMPKGGDLHLHYSGAIYAETFLDWVAKEGNWINRESLKIETSKSPESLTVAELRKEDPLYRELLQRWSDRDFRSFFHEEMAPDEQFFQTFSYFVDLAARHIPAGLRKLKRRAKQENLQYLEIMLAAVDFEYSDPAFDRGLFELKATEQQSAILSQYEDCRKKLDADPRFKQAVGKLVKDVELYHQGMDDDDFLMRYQTYAYRDSPPSSVFASLYAGFSAASQSDLIVGVNILGPENGIIALRDYRLHMLMFHLLHQKFPEVRISLHAGELVLGMVRPENLSFHITEAVRVAGAQRIGHGVDIVHERDSLTLLPQMAAKKIAVEINLTSNQFILGVEGAAHPITVYQRFGVPLVISTDDPGVSRNNLANQYMLMATRYRFPYPTVKEIITNSIRYSFLSPRERERTLGTLQAEFQRFETQMADLADGPQQR